MPPLGLDRDACHPHTGVAPCTYPPAPRAAAGEVNGSSCTERLNQACTAATRSLVRGSFSICGKTNQQRRFGGRQTDQVGRAVMVASMACAPVVHHGKAQGGQPHLQPHTKHNTHLKATVVSVGQGHLAGMRQQLEQRRQRHDNARKHVCQGACACGGGAGGETSVLYFCCWR